MSSACVAAGYLLAKPFVRPDSFSDRLPDRVITVSHRTTKTLRLETREPGTGDAEALGGIAVHEGDVSSSIGHRAGGFDAVVGVSDRGVARNLDRTNSVESVIDVGLQRIG